MSNLIGTLHKVSHLIKGHLRTLKISRQENVTLGIGANLGKHSKVFCETEVGDFSRVAGSITIKGYGKAKIGKYCTIGDQVTIVTTNHKTTHANMQMTLQEKLGFNSLIDYKKPVIIGDNVWIGDRAIILPGVTIGCGAVIGAAAVVTRDIPSFSVAVGVPASVIKERFKKEIADKLLEIKWWDWSVGRIKRNKQLFEEDLKEISIEKLERLIQP